MSPVVVSGVESHAVTDRSVEFSCTLASDDREIDRTIPVELRFHAPDVFRFTMRTTPETPDPTSIPGLPETAETTEDTPVGTDAENGNVASMDGMEARGVTYTADGVREPVSLSTTETDGEVVVETSSLTVRVGLDEWSFAVEDADGRELLDEQRADRNAKDELRTRPLGFTEEVVNGWPLRIDEVRTAFTLRPDERIYGLGEKFTEFEKRGQRIESWITQPNGTETERSYKNVPFYCSSRGYGLLVDTVHRTSFDFGADSSVTTRLEVADDTLRFVFVNGPTPTDVLRRYTAMTGRPHRPKRWTFGVWMSRLTYESQAEVETIAAELRDRSMPCDVLHVDPGWMDLETMCDLRWDDRTFPDPGGMIDRLHEDGFKLSLWEFPYVQVDSPRFEEYARAGYFVEDGTGSPYVLSRLSADNRGAIVDFTDAEAREWWARRHRELTELGVDAFKLDFGEYLPRDATLANGRTGRAMRNRYPRAYQATVQNAMRDAGDERPTLWVRAAWTGDQRFPVHWGGDPNTTFESMAASLRGGLSLACSGFPFWSADVGGFRGTPSRELYVRWAQWALLGHSHARFHGTTPREPWHFGEEAERIVRKHARERYRLLPYLYSYAERASRTGLPVMRPLVLAYPDDPASRTVDTQHLVGEELLIAPMLSVENRREVYLPPGEWVDYWTGERYVGGRTLDVTVPLETVPLYVRAGSVVPRRDPSQSIGDDRWPLRLRVEFRRTEAAGADSAGDSGEGSDDVREATFEYYGVDTDGLVTLTATHDPEAGSLDVDVPDGVTVASVTAARFETAPATVSVDDVRLDRVDADPEAGEWSYAPADGSVTAVAAVDDDGVAAVDDDDDGVAAVDDDDDDA